MDERLKLKVKLDNLLQQLPQADLQQVYLAVEHIYANYLYRTNLRNKGVVMTPLYYEQPHISSKWDLYFAHDVSGETMQRIHYEQFRWHMFSYGIKPCLEKQEARAAFDTVEKQELYMMYQRAGELFKLSNAQQVEASDFDSQQDIYIFDTAFTWTYIHTHEEICGPYFYNMSND